MTDSGSSVTQLVARPAMAFDISDFRNLRAVVRLPEDRCHEVCFLQNARQLRLRIGNEFFNADAVILNSMQTEHAVAEILERSACDNRNLLVRRIFRVDRT